ncbi:MAG: 1,4-dihydroxy-2-naphthoate octaprenyltransferase [Sedimentisphaerales bacterium]|nr:1,4-dihydroxy-2-naphthoate octaprenyltransferase [Sedimentisphaerales bacterium]
MLSNHKRQNITSSLNVWLRELRAPFFTASIVPVFVGTAAAYYSVGVFSLPLFMLALVGMVSLHAGANIANDYFDHTSGNDWFNKNPTPFSGGSRLIQEGLLRPKSVLFACWVALSIGILAGIIILVITKSTLILILGLIGVFGGYFYTASPIRLGYRGIGELIIAFLFGILPVFGSYYLQTQRLDVGPLVPSLIIAGLIFIVILINEFPDKDADGAAGKRTLVVMFGNKSAGLIYRIVLLGTYILAAIAALLYKLSALPYVLYLLTFPLGLYALKSFRQDVPGASGRFNVNIITILLHFLGGIMLSAGFLLVAGLN